MTTDKSTEQAMLREQTGFQFLPEGNRCHHTEEPSLDQLLKRFGAEYDKTLKKLAQ